MEWFRLMPERISLNEINSVTISTVLLPKREADDSDSYETCEFQSNGDSNVIGWYSTADDAIAGHNRIIKEHLMRL